MCQISRRSEYAFSFYSNFASVRKHEEKNRNFGSLYLGNGWSDFLPIWYVDSLGWQATLANLVPIRYEITEIQRCKNDVFFLPVNIPTVWRAGFLGCMTHYRVS